MSGHENKATEIGFRPIGTINTPYKERAPYQPIERNIGEGKFRLIILPEYEEGLSELSKFKYIYVLSYLDRAVRGRNMMVSPPWAGGKKVGLFASRSPNRPNPIGLSIVKIISIEGSEILTSPLDVLDNTPLIDIKPYFSEIDAKQDANCGWLEEMEGKEHLILHIRGVAHEHGHTHQGKKGDGHTHGGDEYKGDDHKHTHGHKKD